MTRMFPRIFLIAALTSIPATGPVFAQAWNPFCSSCAPQQVVQYVPPQNCYTTVPVTEYREHRQVVMKPVVETTYVDQNVTTYDPVVEDRETEVPTVSYQTVTENQQITRDCGYWATQYQYRPKPTPCQYDNRPDLFGLLNRVGYSVTSAFTPNYRVQRAYVPNLQTVNVPVSRQVAVRGTRKVNYRVTNYVPRTITRKVPVNTVRMVREEVVTRRPVTVYHSVPMGTSVATYAPLGNTSTARAPAPNPERTANRPQTRDRERHDHRDFSPERSIPRRGAEDHQDFDDQSNRSGRPEAAIEPIPDLQITKKPATPATDFRLAGYRSVGGVQSDVNTVGRWVARRSTKQPTRARQQGPAFPANMVAMIGEN